MSYTHIYDSSKLEAFIHRNPVTTGETSVEDNSVARWDVGSLINIQDSSILIDDEGDIVIPTGSNVVFEDTGNLTFTESGGSDTITIKGSGSIGNTHKLVLPGVTGATGNALAIESIVGDELRLSWEEQTSLGPGSNVTDNAIVRWDGSGGSRIKNSSILASDNGGITIPVSYNLVFNNTGTLTFKEIGGSNTLKLQSNDTLIGNTVLTLPNSAGTSSQVLTTDGSDIATLSWGTQPSFTSINPVVPTYDCSNFSLTGLNEYLRLNRGYNTLATGESPAPNSGVNIAYGGGAYSPEEDRVYFTPYGQAQQPWWHYINSAGTGIVYANGVTVSNVGYQGNACYAPTLNRVYFAPYLQATTQGGLPTNSQWHYIQCDNSDPPNVVAYDTGLPSWNFVASAYAGAVYSPMQDRIYLAPWKQITGVNWHYIDGSNGNVVAYSAATVTTGTTTGAYWGGGYIPTLNRIYFAPYYQATLANWHYIDCSDGSIVEYAHGLSVVSKAYAGAVYCPTLNRLYFGPAWQAKQSTLHYIDGSNGNFVSYVNSYTADMQNNAYNGGAFFPQQNRIYFGPVGQASKDYWHYIDCSDGSMGRFLHNCSKVGSGFGGLMHHVPLNRSYLVPRAADYYKSWPYITDVNATGMNQVSKVLKNSLFNY